MRVIGSFIISVIILFVGFYATVMTLLSTEKEQYSLVVAAFVLMLLCVRFSGLMSSIFKRRSNL